MRRLARIPALAALLLLPDAATAGPAPLPAPAPPLPASLAPTARNQVAVHWAPTLYQETRDERDLLSAFDFDGDWDGSNNARNLPRYPARAVIYFTVAETATHWLVTYLTYHAVDGKSFSGHDHDSEHVTLVVQKDGSPFGRLQAMETRFHKVLYQYAVQSSGVTNGADDIDGPVHLGDDGRPEVYAQRVGHGLCGGYAPVSWFDTFALRCKHRERPHIAERGVIYRYTGRADVPRSLDDRDVGYALVEIGETLWAHARDRGPHATFSGAMDFEGERCVLFRCPRGIGRAFTSRPGRFSTGMPWEEGGGRGTVKRGEAFFDPALTMWRRLRFPRPFSTGYVHNPYLGVGRFGGHADEAVASASSVSEPAVASSEDDPKAAR